MSNIVLGIIFILIFLVVYKIAFSFTSQEKTKKRRVTGLADAEESFIDLQETYDQEKSAQALLLEKLARPFGNSKANMDELSRKLYQAGYKSPDAASYYLFYSTYGWIPGLLVAYVIYKLSLGTQGSVTYVYYFLALLLGAGLALGAKLTVDGNKQKRNLILTRQFPDALDLLLICVESGLALDAAFARVCRELKYVHPEITDELNRTRLELTLLNDRAKALQNLADRTDLIAFKSLVAALLQSERFGTSLVETLRVLSDDYRQTRMMIAEEKAAKLDPKITASTIPFMLVALLVLILTPAVMEAMKKMPAVNEKTQ